MVLTSARRVGAVAGVTVLALVIPGMSAMAGPDPSATSSTATPTATPTVTPEPTETPGPDLPLPVDHEARALAAASWLSGEIVDGYMPGFSPDSPDWGLTIDTLWALAAADAESEMAVEIAAAVEAHVSDYATYDLWGVPHARVAGAMSKELLTAAVLGADPHDFGGYDVRQEVLDLLAADAGVEQGRVRDVNTGFDSTTIFSQSLAVLGLARTGGVPAEAVRFMLRQQCSAGYFRLFYNDRLTCDEAAGEPDRDGTAMAVQAMLSAREHGITGLDDEIDRALDWFERVQRADGSFGGGVSTEDSNTNSAGLIGQALKADGRDTAYGRAAAWMATMQVSREMATGPLAGEAGAIAYNDDALQSAIDAGLGAGRSQWQRATPQAIFAFAPIPLGELTLGDGTADPDPGSSLSPSPRPTRGAGASPDSKPDRTPAGSDRGSSGSESGGGGQSGGNGAGGGTGGGGGGDSPPSPSPSPSPTPSPMSVPAQSLSTGPPPAPTDDEADEDIINAGSPGDDDRASSGGVPPVGIAITIGVLLGAAVVGGQVLRGAASVRVGRRLRGRCRTGRVRAAALAAVTAGAVGAALVAGPDTAHAAGYAGYCTDDQGVTVVIDFNELGGGTIIRCAPAPLPGGGTGLDAFKGAGIAYEGVRRWGDAFICRIFDKPAIDQEIPIDGTSGYRELCIDTPPAAAYWSYWHAPNGGPWTYNRWGIKNRDAIPGGFEGWSFSLNATASASSPPDVAPVRPEPPPDPNPEPSGDGSGGGGAGNGSSGAGGDGNAGGNGGISGGDGARGNGNTGTPSPGGARTAAGEAPGPTPTPTATATSNQTSSAPGVQGSTPADAEASLLADDATRNRGTAIGTLVGVGAVAFLVTVGLGTAWRRRQSA